VLICLFVVGQSLSVVFVGKNIPLNVKTGGATPGEARPVEIRFAGTNTVASGSQ